MERRALQIVLADLSLIPLAGLVIAFGPGAAFFFPDGGKGAAVPVDLDNQWRYLSGVYTCVTFAIWWSLPHIETRLAPVRIVSAGVMMGGLGRLISMAAYGLPDQTTMVAGVVLELGVVPLLLLWQTRLHRRHVATTAAAVAG